jgi:hypothetical protein
MAFLEGRVESSVTVPAAVLDTLTRQGRPDSRRGGRPLLLTEAELLESEFQTDRGRRRLPAWRLTAEDALGPIWVLDPDVVDWQPAADAGGTPPDLQSPGQDPGARVDVGADDRSVVVHWLGAVPAFERYPSATVIESAQAFAVVPAGVDVGPPGWRTLAGVVHQVPAVLEQPVGARVYVDLHGHAGRSRGRSDRAATRMDRPHGEGLRTQLRPPARRKDAGARFSDADRDHGQGVRRRPAPAMVHEPRRNPDRRAEGHRARQAGRC